MGFLKKPNGTQAAVQEPVVGKTGGGALIKRGEVRPLLICPKCSGSCREGFDEKTMRSIPCSFCAGLGVIDAKRLTQVVEDEPKENKTIKGGQAMQDNRRTCSGKYWTKGEGCKTFDFGLFHQWGNCYEEFNEGPGNYTVAIVEIENGQIIECSPTDIKFTDYLATMPRNELRGEIEATLNKLGKAIANTANATKEWKDNFEEWADEIEDKVIAVAPYNFNILCIGSETPAFTPGQEYAVRNGRIINDNGSKLAVFRNKTELERYVFARFRYAARQPEIEECENEP